MEETSYNFDLDVLLDALAELGPVTESVRELLMNQAVDTTVEFEFQLHDSANVTVVSFMDDLESPDVAFIGEEPAIAAIEAFLDEYLGF